MSNSDHPPLGTRCVICEQTIDIEEEDFTWEELTDEWYHRDCWRMQNRRTSGHTRIATLPYGDTSDE